MDIDYLIQAIEIVITGQLKANHDDTLIEKLVTLVEMNTDIEGFTRKDELKILSVLANSLDIDQPEPTCFRLMAIILADLYVSYGLSSDEEVLDSAFVAFIAASKLISSSADLSLQSSFIRSYAHISRNNRNVLDSNHIRASDLYFLPESITDLMRNSSSYYVRNEAECLLIDLLMNNQGSVESDSRNKLRIELKKIVDSPTEINFNFLKQLASKTSMTRSLIRMEVRDKMFDHFKSVITTPDFDEAFVILCLEVLGSLCPKQSEVDYVIGSLVKLNRLKALVVFTSTLMKSDREHMNKWMQYSLYTLVCKSELRYEVSSQILISVRERNFVEKLCSNSIMLSILTRIPNVLSNIDEKESLLREALQILLAEELKKKSANRKIISEAISCLNKMLQEEISPAKDIINTICELIPLSSGHHLIEFLVICRNFYSRTLPRELVGIDKICHILETIFERHVKNDKIQKDQLYGDQDPESEVLEAAAQVLGVISCSPSIASKIELIKLFRTLFIQNSDDIPFITSSVPVIFSINFELDQEKLKEIFDWDKNVDIVKILCSYLKAQDSSLLKMKVIQTLKDESQFERVSFLQTFRMDLFFKELIPTLCYCILTSVDTETQISVVSLITNLFQFVNEGLIQLLYSSSVLDILYLIIQNKDGSFPRSLRVETSKLVLIIKQAVKDKLSDKGISLSGLLEKNDPPQECISSQTNIKEVNITPIPAQEKVQQIELLFNNSVNQPTIDFIDELNMRRLNCEFSNGVAEKKMKINRTIHDLEELVSFYTNPNNRIIYDDDPDECSLIIDDIISAQIRPNEASTDCY